MKQSPARLAEWFVATVVFGMLASLAAPMLGNAAAQAQDHSGKAAVTVARAVRALRTGDILGAQDFVFVDTTIAWRWNFAAPDTARVQAGWLVRRAIAVGEVLRPPAVVPAPVIVAGSSVQAVWQDGNVRVVLTGVATNTAAAGAPVGVRIDRNRRLDGIAVGPNTVRLR